FYHCTDCELRCKREDVCHPWEDASGPEDEGVYRPEGKKGPSPCSGWWPDRRDARRNGRAMVAFLVRFGYLSFWGPVGLCINTTWAPMFAAGIGLSILVAVRRETAGFPAGTSSDLRDPALDD